MKKVFITIAFLLCARTGMAQQNVQRGLVVSSCGARALTAGTNAEVTMAVDGTLCIGAATLSSGGNEIAVDANGAVSVTGPAITYSSTLPSLTNGQTANDWPIDSKAGMYFVRREQDQTYSAKVDPCDSVAKTTTPISQTADTVIIAKVSAKKTYICDIVAVAGAAEIISIIEGDGSTCSTNRVALAGSTTDASGLSFAANGGFSAIGGSNTVLASNTANLDICLNNSGSNRVSGFVTWVQR